VILRLPGAPKSTKSIVASGEDTELDKTVVEKIGDPLKTWPVSSGRELRWAVGMIRHPASIDNRQWTNEGADA
jgi:hypothetical protein